MENPKTPHFSIVRGSDCDSRQGEGKGVDSEMQRDIISIRRVGVGRAKSHGSVGEASLLYSWEIQSRMVL